MIDIYLIPINQLLTQRCGDISCHTRAVLRFYCNDIITTCIVDKPVLMQNKCVNRLRKSTYTISCYSILFQMNDLLKAIAGMGFNRSVI